MELEGVVTQLVDGFIASKHGNGECLVLPDELLSVEGHDPSLDEEERAFVLLDIFRVLDLADKFRVETIAVNNGVAREQSPSRLEVNQATSHQMSSLGLHLAKHVINKSEK